ncbi:MULTISPECIES: ankyrin repeat domain-containing protein [Sphingomonas]|uniref:ankyrin repeat domain-containing protein n=1 Tax=Sphingomonas TaxID=13687 RepID=UPI0020BDB9C6|nr:ankyrin repeat domain-containing protein [Sphingomonas faeni]MCK8457811.1 ankyrin repeat domain-containing protein [Sphingomonas faeni]MCP8891987.1 ankyrin repeat domain-containing protein [Sphingomonas faeni]
MRIRLMLATALLTPALGMAAPAFAQGQSEGYKFLSAVRDAKNNEVLEMLGRPGSNIINTRDVTNGEGALHIVIKRGDEVYLRFLLQKGADANLRDGKGNTPLLLAVTLGQTGMIPILTAAGANPNLGNSAGETPLIRAVQRRDVGMIRVLLNENADPDQADIIAGMSARDYAKQDGRNPVVSKLLADAPKKVRKAVSGPKF